MENGQTFLQVQHSSVGDFSVSEYCHSYLHLVLQICFAKGTNLNTEFQCLKCVIVNGNSFFYSNLDSLVLLTPLTSSIMYSPRSGEEVVIFRNNGVQLQ